MSFLPSFHIRTSKLLNLKLPHGRREIVYLETTLRNNKESLRCLRVANNSLHQTNGFPCRYHDATRQFSHLECLDILATDQSAAYDTSWPLPSQGNSVVDGKQIPPPLRRLVCQEDMHVQAAETGLSMPAGNSRDLQDLEHLHLGRSSFSYFFTATTLLHLRTLSLNTNLFATEFALPKGVTAEDCLSGPHLHRLLSTPLNLPNLEAFSLIHLEEPQNQIAFPPRPRKWLRPSMYLCRLNAPKIRNPILKGFSRELAHRETLAAYINGQDLATEVLEHFSNLETGSWMKFCDTSPLLEELEADTDFIEPSTSTATVTTSGHGIKAPSEFGKSLPLLKNLRKMSLSKIRLSEAFVNLLQHRKDNGLLLPNLLYLDLGTCTCTVLEMKRVVRSLTRKSEVE
jgi:hypothetical protein